MSVNIDLPHITAPTDAGKLQQMQSYMHQLVEQLNWALNNIDSTSSPSVATPVTTASTASKDDPISNFNSIKGLIIKSADIVSAYYEEINNLIELSGEYVAEATFPEGSATFVEQTNATLAANSQNIEQFYENVQTIASNIETINRMLVDVNAHIKSGLLYYDDQGVPVYGLEVGQRTKVNGVETFNKYARFTSNKLSFYDQNDTEVAYISDYKLYITHVQITGSFQEGGYKDFVDSAGGVITKWVGGA